MTFSKLIPTDRKMPELPEVESLRRYLIREGILGRTFEQIELETKPSPESGTGAISGINQVHGKSIKTLERRGKQLAAVLDQGVLGLHMGMTGQVNVLEPTEPTPRFTRALFNMSNGFRMALVDPRRWAQLRYFDSPDQAFAGLGPDALDPDFSATNFASVLKIRTAQIKPLLLNQSIIAGVGNIYADEALHRIEISPARRANKISNQKLESLLIAIRESLERALEFIKNHPDDRGRPYIVDAYDDRMQLHRKPGSFCPRCEIPLVTLKFGGRTAYYCSNCQK
jgi:formamidopyrimidine-DNA glycosylase